jgi:DNA replication and repair protein RecF
MYLTSLTLRQFRSHSQLQLRVDSGVNLLLGPNGAGKTNFVEAIAVLTMGVSPRGADPETMIQWGQDGFAIKGEFASELASVEPFTLEMKYRIGSSRVVRLNGQTALRLRELIGKAPLVSFVPEDLSLVKGEPDLRRRAVNMVLAQVDPEYADALRRYTDAMKSRNATLRQISDGQLPQDTLLPWNAAVIQAGLVLCRRRAAFLEDFSERVAEIHRRVSGGKEEIRLEYAPSFVGPWDESAAQRWDDRFQWTQAQELATGTTMTGPHRDDVNFLLNGRLARSFGSEGQKRTCAVSFKLAEIPYMQEKTGHKPICLLDDVLSELDAQRAERLLEELSRTGQCFVTMTGLESWPQNRPLPAAVYHVDASGIHPGNETATAVVSDGKSDESPARSGLAVC